MRLPNVESLAIGALITAGYCISRLAGTPSSWIFTVSVLVLGIPLAFLFLLYTNPKQQSVFNIGIVLVFPFCAVFYPVIAVAMLWNKPWESPQWKNRNAD